MTKHRMSLAASAIIIAVVVAVGFGNTSRQPATDFESQVDSVFNQWSGATPGCAVGVNVGGSTVLAKAYGMADLERDVTNTPDTIFEAGSVAKQFTAAAVLLLARDGKLSLDDPARKYLPELPDYGHPLTIRHMLNHTSGLRDWGSVASIAGWPRTTRMHTHAHVLDIVSRQRALNFTPGTRWSYSNTGFNLAAILVSRVSGMSFAEFTRQRIFEPLGMTRTSWRDDHGRIVKGRAVSYVEGRDGFRTLMPFENVHGNGGLLTTVGDLLKWNENFVAPRVGDRAFVAEQERVGRFSDGRAHAYALGLRVDEYKGVRQVAHGGSTAGYRAYLSRYPQPQVSVALLCNVGSVNATRVANAVADVYLARHLKPSVPPKATHSLTASDIDAVVGLYRNTQTSEPLEIVRTNDGVSVENGPTLVALSRSKFVTAGGDALELGGAGSPTRWTDRYGSVDTYLKAEPPVWTAEQLSELAGTYASDDAEVVMSVVVRDSEVALKRRPDTTIKLTPLYADAFSSQLGTIVFRREAGRVTGFSVVQERVWDMRFVRQSAALTSADK